MSLETQLVTMIEKLVRKNVPVVITEGIVTSVDKEKNTCDVNRGDLPELFEVRMNAVLSATGVLTIYPKPQSKVLCAIIENNPTDAYVLTCTDVDEIIFNEGENGGLVKVDALASELTSIKDDLNALKTAFQGWVVVASDGGAALKAAAATWSGQQLAEVDSDALQNVKFKH